MFWNYNKHNKCKNIALCTEMKGETQNRNNINILFDIRSNERSESESFLHCSSFFRIHEEEVYWSVHMQRMGGWKDHWPLCEWRHHENWCSCSRSQENSDERASVQIETTTWARIRVVNKWVKQCIFNFLHIVELRVWRLQVNMLSLENKLSCWGWN